MEHRTRHADTLAVAAACLALAAAFAVPALAGRHLTADDVLFQHLALARAPGEVVEYAAATALRKAKLGEFFSIPVMVAGNAWIDTLAGRLASLAAYGAAIAGFAGWLARAAGGRGAALAGVLALAILPLQAGSLPPTAYPLFPSLQLAIFFLGMLLHRPRGWRAVAGGGLVGLSLVSSEYTLVFCGPILAVHVLLETSGRARIAAMLRDTRIWAAGCAAAGHLALRWVAPGEYTAVSGLDAPGDVLRTQALHIANGTIFGPAAFSGGIDGAWPAHADLALAGLSTVAATWAASVLLARPARCGDGARLLAYGLVGSISVTLPVALLEKYRRWCAPPEECLFVDSRLAGLGIAAALAGAAHLAVARWGGRGLLAAGIGLAALATALHNAAVSDELHRATLPWRLAERAICAADGRRGHPEWRRFLRSRPARRIPFHETPWRDRRNYWQIWAREIGCRG